MGFLVGGQGAPVLHILIHSIFGTRKRTNISVLNSIPSPPLQRPPGPAVAAQSSISGPSLPLPPRTGQGTLQLVWGWLGSQQPALGPWLSLLPSLSCGVPHRPSGAAWRRGGGRRALPGSGEVRRPGRLALWGGQGPGTCPQPSPSQGPSREGSSRLPTTTAETPGLLPRLRVRTCARVALRAARCAEPRVRPSGAPPGGAARAGAGPSGAHEVACATAPVSSSKESPRPPCPGRCGWPGARPAARPLGRHRGRGGSTPHQALGGPGRPLESGHRQPWGEAKTPEGFPAPLTVTPHAQRGLRGGGPGRF